MEGIDFNPQQSPSNDGVGAEPLDVLAPSSEPMNSTCSSYDMCVFAQTTAVNQLAKDSKSEDKGIAPMTY